VRADRRCCASTTLHSRTPLDTVLNRFDNGLITTATHPVPWSTDRAARDRPWQDPEEKTRTDRVRTGGDVAPSTRAAGSALAQLTAVRGLLYGGDYAPEQWPATTWREDARLMRAAGVNLVTVNAFGWSRIEPAEGERDFAWLDEVLDLLHESGIAVDLATPTASPPAWMATRYPQTRPVTADGVRLWHGSRNHFCPTASVYRDRARAIATDLALRYAD